MIRNDWYWSMDHGGVPSIDYTQLPIHLIKFTICHEGHDHMTHDSLQYNIYARKCTVFEAGLEKRPVCAGL